MIDEYSKRLIRHYRNTPRPLIEDGKNWYKNANSFFVALGRKYNLSPEQILGIVAALSPFVSWETQLNETENFLRTHHFPGFRNNVRNAISILSGTPPELVLKGPKVYAFYKALLGDDSQITIDRHAISACLNRSIGNNERHTSRDLDTFRRAYIIGSGYYSHSPRDFQAIIWRYWKWKKVEGIESDSLSGRF